MNYKILSGDKNQLEEIVNLNYSIFENMYVDEPYSLGKYKAKLSEVSPVIFLAINEKNGKIMGDSIAFERDKSHYIWILAVLNEHQKQGIGTDLLKTNEDYARRCLLDSVTVKTYNVSPEIQRLLIKRGYNIVAVEPAELDPKYNAVHFELKLEK